MQDSILWKKFREGDKAAFQLIYEKESNRLLLYGYKICTDFGLVEDCLHDLFVDLWQKRDNIGETNNIQAYLFVSFRRRIFSDLKKIKKIDSDEKKVNIFSTTGTKEDEIIKNEEFNNKKNKLTSLMSNLSKRQKEIIHLKYFQELDYDKISEIMDISYQSARNLLHGAIKKMQKRLHLYFIFLFFQNFL